MVDEGGTMPFAGITMATQCSLYSTLPSQIMRCCLDDYRNDILRQDTKIIHITFPKESSPSFLHVDLIVLVYKFVLYYG